MKTLTLQGVKFTLSDCGMATSSEFSDLGNIEDCQDFAALVWHLFDTLQSDNII